MKLKRSLFKRISFEINYYLKKIFLKKKKVIVIDAYTIIIKNNY
jgi:hypothetical protein